MVSCPNKCLNKKGRENKFLRKELEKHESEACPNRKYECPHCNEWGLYEERVTTHLQDCPMIPCMCPNEGCDVEICSSLVHYHVITDCEYTIEECKYKHVGCNAQPLRKDLEEHENDDKEHLQVVIKSMVKLQDRLTEQRDQLISTQSKIASLEEQYKTYTLEEGKSMTFKLTQFQDKKRDRVTYTSPSFYTRPNGYKMNIRIQARGISGEHISLCVEILEGLHDTNLEWPFTGSVKIELLNQLADEHHYVRIISFEKHNAKVGSTRGTLFIHHCELRCRYFYNQLFLKDDTLYFRVSVATADHKPWLECTHVCP